MLFATATLARRIETAEGRLATDFAHSVRDRWPDVLVSPVGSANAVYVGPGQPFNKLVALGLGEAIDEDALARAEQAFDDRNAPLQVELATLADGAAALLLARRGYVLTGFESVLALELRTELIERMAPAVERDRGAGLAVQRIDAARLSEWVHVVTTGFASPDVGDGPEAHQSFPREALERVFTCLGELDGFAMYLVERAGAMAGGGSLRARAGVAQLCGAATLPEHRRRGVQSALLRARLLDATRAGADLAVVTTVPGSKSQENVQRAGFTLLYARAIMVRPATAERA